MDTKQMNRAFSAFRGSFVTGRLEIEFSFSRLSFCLPRYSAACILLSFELLNLDSNVDCKKRSCQSKDIQNALNVVEETKI